MLEILFEKQVFGFFSCVKFNAYINTYLIDFFVVASQINTT